MTRVHDMFPDKHMYFTEGGPPAHLFGPSEERHAERQHRREDDRFGTDWGQMVQLFHGHAPELVAVHLRLESAA
jgi:hypothetical protein